MEKSRKKIRLNSRTVDEHLTNEIPTSEVLNDDCLLHVFKYLPICDRVRLERVNRRWYAVSRMSWKSLKELTFTNQLWGCLNGAKITRNVLKKILHLCGSFLKILNMSATPVLEKEIDIKSLLNLCPNLTSVDFRSFTVRAPVIRSLIKNNQNIVKFKMRKKTHYVSSQFLKDTIFSTYKNLKVLSMECIGTHIKQVEFKNNGSIEDLRLEYCSVDIWNFATIVPQLQNLHTLSLKGSLVSSGYSGDLDFIKLSNIEVLDISHNFRYVNDTFLMKTASACGRLKSLSIGHNYKVTDEGVKAVTASRNLMFLNIDGLNLTGTSLSDLPHLKSLSCCHCQSLNPKHLQSLFNTSDRLESIDLRHVKNAYRIIKSAIKSTNSRKNDITLRMLVHSGCKCCRHAKQIETGSVISRTGILVVNEEFAAKNARSSST